MFFVSAVAVDTAATATTNDNRTCAAGSVAFIRESVEDSARRARLTVHHHNGATEDFRLPNSYRKHVRTHAGAHCMIRCDFGTAVVCSFISTLNSDAIFINSLRWETTVSLLETSGLFCHVLLQNDLILYA